MKQPLFNRVLIRPIKKSLSTIIVADDNSYIVTGTVIGVGSQAGVRGTTRFHWFRVADEVLYPKSEAIEVTLEDGTKAHLIKDEHVFMG